MQWIRSLDSPITHFTIYCDCQAVSSPTSSLTAHLQRQSRIFSHIFDLIDLEHNHGRTVTILWIPGHCGFDLHDAVDTMATAALAISTASLPPLIPLRALRRTTHKKIQDHTADFCQQARPHSGNSTPSRRLHHTKSIQQRARRHVRPLPVSARQPRAPPIPLSRRPPRPPKVRNRRCPPRTLHPTNIRPGQSLPGVCPSSASDAQAGASSPPPRHLHRLPHVASHRQAHLRPLQAAEIPRLTRTPTVETTRAAYSLCPRDRVGFRALPV
mmetsp:Transcript_5223/g.12559  ORF Transcript_5223/g.12559 Transcript_5223/m.12559 type:complete len:270 (-) Transcript_5223:551-1360(-)